MLKPRTGDHYAKERCILHYVVYYCYHTTPPTFALSSSMVNYIQRLHFATLVAMQILNILGTDLHGESAKRDINYEIKERPTTRGPSF